MSLTTDKQSKRVLVVDDVTDNIFLLQFILESQGYQVDTAQSGKAALAQIETANPKPDLIILDLMMPEMNGFEVIDRLRNQKKLPHIPTILMTANTSVSCQQAKGAGADEVIYKPLELKQFVAKIARF